MSKERPRNGTSPEGIISIVGPGMVVVGDCETDGTLRVEGTVRGSITAGKAVVVGKEGVVDGDIRTEDAVVAGHVTGTLVAGSRLELQSTSRIDGDVRARRMRLEEGALLNGTVLMGESAGQKTLPEAASVPTPGESVEVAVAVAAPAVAAPEPPQLRSGPGAPSEGSEEDAPDARPSPTSSTSRGGNPRPLDGPAGGQPLQARSMESGAQE